jgi:hypothetical protein
VTERVLAGMVVFCILVPVAFVGYAILGKWVLHGPVNAQTLARSMELAGIGGSASCARTSDAHVWECAVYSASSSHRVLVRVRPGSSCWEARRTDGCVHRWQWAL